MKATLFRTFCSNMYCGHLWHGFRKRALRKLIVGYNHSLRFLMKCHRNCSASSMFVSNFVPSFMEMGVNIYIYGFTQRLANTDNAIAAIVAAHPAECHPIFGNDGTLYYTRHLNCISNFTYRYFWFNTIMSLRQ